MGRPPSNGGPSFRFNPVEVGEMEAILQAHNYTVPAREILEALAHRFSTHADRAGKVEVSSKQVWNWFQNRRYALRAKAAKTSFPGQSNVMPVPRDDQSVVRNVPQPPQPPQPQPSQPLPAHAPPTTVRSVPQVPQPLPAPSAPTTGRNASENFQMEFEAKSARDGAWYDVTSFLSHRSLESGDPEALVRFAGFGPEEDEWVDICRHIRQRSLPCESSECVAVLPGDLILCFQEGKEQALYFDAHVLDAQRRRHDVRGCRCRFLVRYDHDQSEEIVPLRKICRRPETDYRLQQLHGGRANVNPHKVGTEAQSGNTLKDGPIQKQPNPKQEECTDTLSTPVSATPTNVSSANESKLPPSNITDSGNRIPAPTNAPLADESNLQPSKIADSENASSVPTNVPLAGESNLTTSKIADSGNASSVPTNVPLANESNITTPKIADSGNASFAPANVPLADESNLTTSKIIDSGNVSFVPTNVPSVDESNLTTSKIADSGNASFVPTDVPLANESNLLPSEVADSGNATSDGNTNSSNAVALVNTAVTDGSDPTDQHSAVVDRAKVSFE